MISVLRAFAKCSGHERILLVSSLFVQILGLWILSLGRGSAFPIEQVQVTKSSAECSAREALDFSL